MAKLSNPPQQWYELLYQNHFGSDFGADFGTLFPQYVEEYPQVIIIDGCWIQRSRNK